MKTIVMAVAILVAGSTTTFAQAKHPAKHPHTQTATKYTCSMHPEVVRSKPGKCPKCGMTLVPMKAKGTKKGMEGMKM